MQNRLTKKSHLGLKNKFHIYPARFPNKLPIFKFFMGRHRAIVVDCRRISDTLNRFSVPGEQDFENMAL